MSPPRARLLCRTGEFAGATYDLSGDNTIGRDDSNDVVLLASTVSGRHARIYWKDGAFFIEDLASRNGTLLDGVPVTEPVRLDGLNVITVSEAYDLVFHTSAQAQPAPTAAPSPPVAEPPAPAPAQAASPSQPSPPAPAPSPPVMDEPPPPEDVQTPVEDLPTPLPVGPATHSRTRVDLAAFGPIPDLHPAPPQDQPAAGAAYYLLIEVEGQETQRAELPAQGGTLGRSKDCDVIIGHESLSRKHAQIRLEHGKLLLKDLGSTNGTFLGDREISEIAIAPGDTFKLGTDVTVRIEKR